MVGYDHQVKQVVDDLAKVAKKGAVIVITATSHPDMVIECAKWPANGGIGVIDAPVCFGLGGARDGTLALAGRRRRQGRGQGAPGARMLQPRGAPSGELGAGESARRSTT